MKWVFFSVIGLYAFGYFKKTVDVKLKYFDQSEFGAWWPLINKELLIKLDDFRGQWGHPVMISPAFGAIGRTLSPTDNSQHNVARWGEVRAVDIMPIIQTPDGRRRGMEKNELMQAYQLALRTGFHGVGVYPEWRPYVGLHVDVREDRDSNNPAKWARVNGIYTGVAEAWV